MEEKPKVDEEDNEKLEVIKEDKNKLKFEDVRCENEDYINRHFAFESSDLINKGQYFVIYKAKDKSLNNEYVFLEIINLPNKDKEDEKKEFVTKFFNEQVSLLNEYKGKYFIKLNYTFRTINNYILVTDFYQMNLKNYLEKEGKTLDVNQIRELFNKINEVLKIIYEKKKKLINLIPSAIFLDFDENNYLIPKLIGNSDLPINYMSPERMNNDFYNEDNFLYSDEKDAMWSLGVLLYKTSKNKDLFSSLDQESYLKEIQMGHYLSSINSEKDDNLKDLIKNLVEIDPNKRLSFVDYLNHPFWGKKIIDSKDDKLLKEYNKTYNTNYKLYSEELVVDINDKIEKNDLIKLSQIHFNELKKLKINTKETNKCFEWLKYFSAKNLVELDLSKNDISKIDIFDKLSFKNLQILKLSKNHIDNIDFLINLPFPEIRKLILDHNCITNIDKLYKIDFKYIELINLRSNQISNINVLYKLPPKLLQKLDLTDNSIYIDQNNKSSLSLNLIKIRFFNYYFETFINCFDDEEELKETIITHFELENTKKSQIIIVYVLEDVIEPKIINTTSDLEQIKSFKGYINVLIDYNFNFSKNLCYKEISPQYEIMSILENNNKLRNEINNEKMYKKATPKDYLEKNLNIDLLKLYSSNLKEAETFVLNLISFVLDKSGIETYILNDNEETIKNDDSFKSIQDICFGGRNLEKYILHLKLGKEKVNEILESANEFNKFSLEYKSKISKLFNININDIIITNPRKGSLKIDVVIIGYPEITPEEFLTKLKRNDFNLESVNKKDIIDIIKFSRCIFDSRGNRSSDWGLNETRGGENYIPPLDWLGFGLKVLNQFDNGDNNWLSYEHPPNEYCIAYLPLWDKMELSENIKKLLLSKGIPNKSYSFLSQSFEKCINRKDPQNGLCGKGICLFQDIKIAEAFTSPIRIGYNLYKVVFMCRVKPDKIRSPNEFKELWILNSDSLEIRQYRILVKVEKEFPLYDDSLVVYFRPQDFYREIMIQKDESFFNTNNIRSHYNDKEFVLRTYTAGKYPYGGNTFLRTGNPNDYEKYGITKKNMYSFIYCLHKVLTDNELFSEKIEKVKDEEKLYRGVNIKFSDNLKVGSIFYFGGFTSASRSEEIARSFGGFKTLLVITITNNSGPNGKNYCYYIEELSQYKKQEEVIISAYCSFIITKIEKGENNDVVYLTCLGYTLEDTNPEDWEENKDYELIQHPGNNTNNTNYCNIF